MAGLEPANAGVKVPCLTTWLHPNIAGCRRRGRSGRPGPLAMRTYGVDDGTRTRDTRNHNPMLYQLNYIHHETGAPTVWLYGKKQSGTPGVWPVRERPVARSPAKVPPEEDAPQARPIRVRGFDRNPPLANANAKNQKRGTPGVWPVRERPVARSPAKVPPEEDAPQARPIRVRGFDRNPPLANANAKNQKRGTPGGTRTPGPLLRRQLLYPPELQAHMERVMGIEPTRPAWKAGILPLNYTRMGKKMSALV